MSHTTSLRTIAIRDTGAIRQAVSALQAKGIRCSLLTDTVPRMYYNNQHGKCDFVLKLDGSRYDVGFDKQADGTYALVFDEWAGEVGRVIGAACPMPTTPEGKAQHALGQFMQEYTLAATINTAVTQGYSVESSTIDQAGNVHLTLGGM